LNLERNLSTQNTRRQHDTTLERTLSGARDDVCVSKADISKIETLRLLDVLSKTFSEVRGTRHKSHNSLLHPSFNIPNIDDAARYDAYYNIFPHKLASCAGV
jgi:hypothetical protein